MKPVEVILVTYPDDFRLKEAKSLVESMPNWHVAKIFTQKYLNHSEYGMGSGKAEELKEFIKEDFATTAKQIVIDERLTSKQLHNLEKLTGIRVIDRDRLILDIFYARATTNEAKLQIQLAEIKYDMPRVREIAKMSKGNERPGKGGSGEYVVDTKFRDLKRRMSFIKDKLDEAKKKRELYHYHHQRQRQKSDDVFIVSLVGYTSAGKTTLFNLLTSEHKQTSASLFTTLSTTTRALKIDGEAPIAMREMPMTLITDTVGFISRLPTYMIDAFKSTLEESLAADLILLLVDSSEDIEDIHIKYSSCWDVLDELKVDKAKVLVVLTKHDAIGEKKLNEVMQQLQLRESIVISSRTGYGIRKLKNLIACARPKATGDKRP